MFEIRRYSENDKDEWNQFVATSKNGTFLFDRGYMDYHSDRFKDHSLMFYHAGKLIALLPANEDDGVLYSHQGLTYGGLITGVSVTAAKALMIFREMNDYLREQNFKKVIYKVIPWIYHRLPAEEDIYAIYKECNARLLTRDISSTIFLKNQLRWTNGRRCGINKARNNGVTVSMSEDYSSFWTILENNLLSKYGVHPVHSLQEMTLLKSRFPNNIQLYLALKDGIAIAGTVLYLTPQVIHTQYISANPLGKHLCAIDAIFNVIFHDDRFTGYPYLDFGKSTEDNGHILNESLIFQKEGFGGRGVCYDWYEWTL